MVISIVRGKGMYRWRMFAIDITGGGGVPRTLFPCPTLRSKIVAESVVHRPLKAVDATKEPNMESFVASFHAGSILRYTPGVMLVWPTGRDYRR